MSNKTGSRLFHSHPYVAPPFILSFTPISLASLFAHVSVISCFSAFSSHCTKHIGSNSIDRLELVSLILRSSHSLPFPTSPIPNMSDENDSHLVPKGGKSNKAAASSSSVDPSSHSSLGGIKRNAKGG